MNTNGAYHCHNNSFSVNDNHHTFNHNHMSNHYISMHSTVAARVDSQDHSRSRNSIETIHSTISDTSYRQANEQTDVETFNAALALINTKNDTQSIQYYSSGNQTFQQYHPIPISEIRTTSRLVTSNASMTSINTYGFPLSHYGVSSVTPQGSFDNSIDSKSSVSTRIDNQIKYNYDDRGKSDSSLWSSNYLFSSTNKAKNASFVASNIEPYSTIMAVETSRTTNATSIVMADEATSTTSLALSNDEEFLSSLHCFMRKYCFEAVVHHSSTVINQTVHNEVSCSRNKRIKYDIVGIQCIFCKHLPYHKRPDRSITYPSSIENIYYSMETWQRRHAVVCKYITPSVKHEMTRLSVLSKGIGGGRRKYWAESAAMQGMIDTPRGIEFKSKHNDSLEDDNVASLPPLVCSSSSTKNSISDDIHVDVMGSNTVEVSANKGDINSEPVIALVHPKDKSVVSAYLFLLVSQMERCAFTERDRTGGRSKVKTHEVGMPGLQCKHCCGKSGYGRYFPTSLNQLNLANSDRNMHNHLLKCWKCPMDVKDKLSKLRAKKVNGERKKTNECRGGRKVFFERVWKRLHHDSTSKRDLEGDISNDDFEKEDEVSSIPSSVVDRIVPSILVGKQDEIVTNNTSCVEL